MTTDERTERLLPQNVEIERCVLGSILIDSMELHTVMQILRPSDFYREAHRLIYAAMVDMTHQRVPVDVMTLYDELARRGQLDEVGGISYVTSLPNMVPTSSRAAEYARIVEAKALQRRVIKAAADIASVAYQEPDSHELIETTNTILQTAILRHAVSDSTDIADAIDAFLAEIDQSIDEGVVPGITTGFRDLDKHLLGIKPGELVYLCGRPGSGKSAIAAAAAEYVARTHGRVEWVSLEMSHVQQVKRLIASWASVNGRVLRAAFRRPDGTIWEEKLAEVRALALAAREELRGKLGIYDHPLTMSQLRQHATRAAYSRGLDLLVVDYLGLVDGDDDRQSEYQRISQISRALKQLALDLKLPILCLVQMNRESEKRHNKRPVLSDLRDSGGLEQDADFVLGVYRGAYYNRKLAKLDPTFAQLCEVIVLKARDGQSNETIPLRFEAEYTRPSDWPEDWPWEVYLKSDADNDGDAA